VLTLVILAAIVIAIVVGARFLAARRKQVERAVIMLDHLFIVPPVRPASDALASRG